MKKILLIFGLILAFAIESPAQIPPKQSFGFTLQFGTTGSRATKANANALWRKQWPSGWFVYNFSLVSNSLSPSTGSYWAETRIGIGKGWNIEKLGYFETGFSAGMETDSIPLRLESFLFWKSPNKRTMTLLDIERGGSGAWHLFFVQHKLSERLAIGFRSQKFWATGPMLAWKIPKTPLTFWGTAGYRPFVESKPKALLFGLNVKP